MRKLLVPVLLSVALAAPGAAFVATTAAYAATTTAAQSASGVVKSFDAKTHTLTLADGKVYILAANAKDPGLKAGQKVKVDYTINGKAMDASAVTIE